MPGKKEINADLELKGKLTIHTVPNSMGTGVFVYNPTTKEASQRTYAQFITDLSLSTTGHSHTFASITSKPTTIAGYGITDAMTTSHAANSVTSTNISNWNTAFANNHTHSNKANLDTINQDLATTSSVTFSNVIVSGAAGNYRGISFRTNNVGRWLLSINNVPETPHQLEGSDLEIHRYYNTGDYAGQILTMSRQSGLTTFYESVHTTKNYSFNGSLFARYSNGVNGLEYIVKESEDRMEMNMNSKTGGGRIQMRTIADGASLRLFGSVGEAFGLSEQYLHLPLPDAKLRVRRFGNYLVGYAAVINGDSLFEGSVTSTGNFTGNAFVKTGGTGTNVLLDNGLTKPLSELGGISVVPAGGISNASSYWDIYRNKVWFDYNWAGSSHVGSVISFTGLPNSSYAVELFGNFGDGSIFGLRTRNGDTNQWNPARYIWHTGNLSPVTTNTSQIITAHKVFLDGGGDEYHNGGIEIRRSVPGRFPTLAFHQTIDGYAGTIRLKSTAFEFQNATNGFIQLRASGYVVSGANNTGFLKAGGAVDYTAYAINNGSDWKGAANGLNHNTTVTGKTLNSSGQTVPLRDATYGSVSGVINVASIAAGNPDDSWFHRLKMLHENASGYYTEIAVQMTGGSSLWFKTYSGGATNNPNNVNGWIQAVDTLNDQTIRGAKTFISSVIAPAFYENSLRELKENIKPIKKSGLELVNALEIVTFDRIDKTAVNKIGIIADDSPKEFLSENLDAVDLYKTVFIQAKAIQELQKENEHLKEQLHNLQELVMANLNNI